MFPLHLRQVQARKLYTNKNLSCAKNIWKKGYVHTATDASLPTDPTNLDKTIVKTANIRQNNAWYSLIPVIVSTVKDVTSSIILPKGRLDSYYKGSYSI